MKKYCLLTYETNNIGDEIQSLAAAQFLPRIDHYIPRDNLSNYKDSGDLYVILNGWFMKEPVRLSNKLQEKAYYFIHRFIPKKFDWPPPENIHPLFISFHANDNSIVNDEFAGYYKKVAPIGCRDEYTVALFRKIRVEAYFSGCLTLTLKNSDPAGRQNYICFTDVDKKISEILLRNNKEKVMHLTHYSHTKDSKVKFARAKELIDIYSKAKLVITSRIHCALPCVGLGTPVIFLHDNFNDIRFGGLKDLFRKYSFDDIVRGDYRINWQDPDPNPVDITDMTDKLRKTCFDFVK
jgi:hypothetical protein